MKAGATDWLCSGTYSDVSITEWVQPGPNPWTTPLLQNPMNYMQPCPLL